MFDMVYEYVKLVFVATIVVVISVLLVVQARLEDNQIASALEKGK